MSGTGISAKNGGDLLSLNAKKFSFTIAIIRPIRYNSKDNRVVMRIARKRLVGVLLASALYQRNEGCVWID